VPPVIDPPMIMTSLTSGTLCRVFFRRPERWLVSGPTGTSVISWRSGVHHLNDQVGAPAESTFAFAGRQFDIASPFLPCQNSL